MKKFLLLAASFILIVTCFAQTSGGPDPYGYRWKKNGHPVTPPVFKWKDISTIGTLVTGLEDDNFDGPFLGSNGFQFYWYGMPQFYIGSNGFVSFTGANIASPFPAVIPSALGTNNFMAMFLADLNFASIPGFTNPGKCYYWSNADTLVVTFEEVPLWANATPNWTGSNTFQMILDKNDYSITYNYLSMDPGTYTFVDNIAGIENVSGTLGLSHFTDSVPADSTVIQYTYPPVVTYNVLDAGINWASNERDGGEFMKAQAIPKPFIANVRNFGNTALTNLTVYDTVYNSSGTALSGGMVSLSSLAVGADTTIQFPDSFSAPSAGTYVLRTRVEVSGDLVPANDFGDLELVAVDTTANQMNLDYSDGTANGAGLGWNGGDGGIGIYIEPPIYPAKVRDTRYYISSNTTPPVGFHAKIYDDDGPNGERGTLLDSVFVSGGSAGQNNYKNVQPSSTVIIDSGGVYVVWEMDGPNINIGRDTDRPISRRTYELISGGWSPYRDLDNEDFLIGMRVRYAFPVVDFDVDKSNDPQVIFTDLSINNPTSWFWEFGDGSTDTVQNPSHTYQSNDTFNVCLSATNQYGTGKKCQDVVIEKIMPEANFSFDDSNWPAVSFTDLSTGPPTQWKWDFDDNTSVDTSTQPNPVYTFTTGGFHNVCLIATNANGSSAPFCDTVGFSVDGIEDFGKNNLVAFPNPMTNEMQIRWKNNFDKKSLTLEISDMNGRKIKADYTIDDRKITLYRGVLLSGNYLLVISDGVMTERVKIKVE